MIFIIFLLFENSFRVMVRQIILRIVFEEANQEDYRNIARLCWLLNAKTATILAFVALFLLESWFSLLFSLTNLVPRTVAFSMCCLLNTRNSDIKHFILKHQHFSHMTNFFVINKNCPNNAVDSAVLRVVYSIVLATRISVYYVQFINIIQWMTIFCAEFLMQTPGNTCFSKETPYQNKQK